MDVYEYKVYFMEEDFQGLAVKKLNSFGNRGWKAFRADGRFFCFARLMGDNTKYEYKIFAICESFPGTKTEKELNRFGAEGWEAYATLGNWIQLRRKKPTRKNKKKD